MNTHPALIGVDQNKLQARLQCYAEQDLETRASIHGTLLSSLFMGAEAVSHGAKSWLVEMTRLEIAVLMSFAEDRVPIRVGLDLAQSEPSPSPLVTPHGEDALHTLVTKSLSGELNPALSALIDAYVCAGYIDLEIARAPLRGLPGRGTYLEAALLSKNANSVRALMHAGARIEGCPSSDLLIKTSSGTVAITKGDYGSLLEISCGPGDPAGLRAVVEEGLRYQAAKAMSQRIDSVAGDAVTGSAQRPAHVPRRRAI